MSSKLTNTITFFILSSCLVFAQQGNEKQNTKAKQTILFVCEHGAGRSAIAAAYFNKVADNQGLDYQAIFRGIDPQEALGASTKAGLIKDSVDVTNLSPTKLSKNDADNAYRVITLDCILSDNFKKADAQWTGIPMNGNYDASKKVVASKVDSLIRALPKKKR